MVAAIDQMIDSVRTIASDLRFNGAGELVPALERMARDFERRARIRCLLDLAGSIELSSERAGWVIAVVREALTNVVRHAGATVVRVTARTGRRWLVVTVADNGVGIPAAPAESLGVTGMRERASLLRGTLEIRPGRSAGTVVRLRVPIDAASEHR